MQTLNFEGHLTTRWFESKRQFRSLFWEDLQMKLRNETKFMIQQMIQTEFNFLIGAEPYQRASGRKTKRNGSYTRSLETVVGRIDEIRIPRARNLDIRFSLFDRWQQVETALSKPCFKPISSEDRVPAPRRSSRLSVIPGSQNLFSRDSPIALKRISIPGSTAPSPSFGRISLSTVWSSTSEKWNSNSGASFGL